MKDKVILVLAHFIVWSFIALQVFLIFKTKGLWGFFLIALIVYYRIKEREK